MMLQLVALCLLLSAASAQWIPGRATFFADTYDPWQMSQGSCMYGYLSKNKCTGWDVAALADTNPDFSYGNNKNCGYCYEVRCRNTAYLRDGYGAQFDRNVCFNAGASVTVQVIDTCACNYAPNAYSNRRWCCGDIPHFDLSVWAFEKLAAKKWGVIAIEYRRVDCGYRSGNQAYRPSGVPETPIGEQPPSGWNGKDGRSCPGRRAPAPRAAPKPKASSSGVSISTWSVRGWSGKGVNGGRAQACGTLLPYGGFSLNGAFSGKKAIEFWVQRNDRGTPQVVVKGQGRGCGSKQLSWMSQVGYGGNNYMKYWLNFNDIGCKPSKILIQNNAGNSWQTLCVDGGKLH